MTGFVYYTILRRMIKNYHSQGYEIVSSKHPDYPDDIHHLLHGYRPDLLACRNGAYIICDVETIETLKLRETVRNLYLLSNCSYSLHVAVPSSCYEQARSIASLNNIEVLHWWKLLV